MAFEVLLVDDSNLIRRMTRDVLKGLIEDINFTEVSRGEDAVIEALSGKFDFMTLDLNMPDITGFDVLERLKDEGLKTKIVVMSANIQPKAKERVLASGALAFIEKPVKKERIEVVLQELGIV